MFCSQCAHNLTPSDVYCPNCAKPVASFNFDPGQAPQVEYVGDDEQLTAVRMPPRDPRSPNRFVGPLVGAVIATLGILLAAAVGYIAFVKPSPVAVSNVAAVTPTPDQSAEVRRAEKAANDAAIALNKSMPPPTPKPTKTPIDMDAMRAEINEREQRQMAENRVEHLPASNRAMLNSMRSDARSEAQQRGGCYSGPNGLSFEYPGGGYSLGAYQPVTVLGIAQSQYQIEYKGQIGWVSKSVVVCFRQ